MILKGLSTAQYDGQVGKVLSHGAAATQDRIPVALTNGKKHSVKLSKQKVEAGERLEDSMPPSHKLHTMPSQTNHGHFGNTWESKIRSPKILCRLSRMMAARRLPSQSRNIQGSEAHFQQVACRKRRRRSTGGRWHGDPNAERRHTQLCRGHQSDSQRSDRTAAQWSGWQDFEKLHDCVNTGQDTSGPDERAQA